MAKAIGMLEYMNVPTGVRAADTVLKTSQVEMLEAQTVCPGKYIMLFTGEISAVKASLEAGGQYDGLIDSFFTGRIDRTQNRSWYVWKILYDADWRGCSCRSGNRKGKEGSSGERNVFGQLRDSASGQSIVGSNYVKQLRKQIT